MHKSFLSIKLAGIATVMLASLFFFDSLASAQETGGIKGKIRTMSGNGIGGANVVVRQDGEDVKSANADGKGSFVIDGLKAGLYNLVFDAKGYSSGILYNVEVKKKKFRDLGDRLMLSADQGTQVIIKGSVFFKEGTSITAARVDLIEIKSDGSERKIASSETNISGEFTFRRPPGNAKLRITAKFNGVTGAKDIDVDEAAIYRLAITLDTSRTEK